MENFVDGFRKRYPYVPEELYGRHARTRAEMEPSIAPNAGTRQPQSVNSLAAGHVRSTQQTIAEDRSGEGRPKIRIALKRGNGTDWTPVQSNTNQVARSNTSTSVSDSVYQKGGIQNVIGVSSVAEGVSSFLSGIRASFRQDNVYVQSSQQSNRGIANKKKSNDIKN